MVCRSKMIIDWATYGLLSAYNTSRCGLEHPAGDRRPLAFIWRAYWVQYSAASFYSFCCDLHQLLMDMQYLSFKCSSLVHCSFTLPVSSLVCIVVSWSAAFFSFPLIAAASSCWEGGMKTMSWKQRTVDDLWEPSANVTLRFYASSVDLLVFGCSYSINNVLFESESKKKELLCMFVLSKTDERNRNAIWMH